MLAPALTHAFLIVAAAGAAAPRAVSENDRNAADSYAKDGIAWTQELTSMGEKLGHMFVDVIEGKQTGKAVRAEIKRVAGLIDDRLAAFKARPSPGFPEMVAYRAFFLDYLAWERRVFAPMMNELLTIAEDRKQTRAEKGKAFMKAAGAYDTEEKVWKAKFEPAQKSLYAAINRK